MYVSRAEAGTGEMEHSWVLNTVIYNLFTIYK